MLKYNNELKQLRKAVQGSARQHEEDDDAGMFPVQMREALLAMEQKLKNKKFSDQMVSFRQPMEILMPWLSRWLSGTIRVRLSVIKNYLGETDHNQSNQTILHEFQEIMAEKAFCNGRVQPRSIQKFQSIIKSWSSCGRQYKEVLHNMKKMMTQECFL